jgi:hypothetical protein
MSVDQLVEWLAGETEILGEKLPHCRFVHHTFHMTVSGLEPRATPLDMWHGLYLNTHWEASFCHSRDLLLQERGQRMNCTNCLLAVRVSPQTERV